MRNVYQNLFLSIRFFQTTGLITLLFIVSFSFPLLLPVAKACLVIFLSLVLVDIVLLFNRSIRFNCARSVPKIMSLGNENRITTSLENDSGIALDISLVDEIPYQFQVREQLHRFKLKTRESKVITSDLRPIVRGEYEFGKVT